MAKKRKITWQKKPCGCVKTELQHTGRVLIRCGRHRGKPAKQQRVLCYFGEDGIIRLEDCIE